MKSKKIKVELTPEEKRQKELDLMEQNAKCNLKEYINRKFRYENPKRVFPVGYTWDYTRKYESKSNSFDETFNYIIKEVYANGLFYKVECSGIKAVYGFPKNHFNISIMSWLDIFDKDKEKHTNFAKRDLLSVQYFNKYLESIIFDHYHFGINYDHEVQRGYVWDDLDKENLIYSIFENIEIGRFLFMEDKHPEFKYRSSIIDGKQRLSTIIEFYEDRFSYKGVYFSELSERDRNLFLSRVISVGEIRETLSQKDILELFIRINTTGKVMNPDHLAKLQEKLDTIK